MKLERKLVPIDSSYAMMLQMAALEGCDVSQSVPGAMRYVGFGNSKHGYGPVCLVDVKEAEAVIEPHVTWLPWCGAKEKVAAFKWAMELFSQQKAVLLMATKEQAKFFDHFVGDNLKKIGVFDNIPNECSEIHFYQVERRK